MFVVAGEYNLVENEGFEQERRVVRVFKHPEYDKQKVDNDIALLKLNAPLEYSERVKPACLPEQNEDIKLETAATIVGWGAISYQKDPITKAPKVERDDMLYQAIVPIVDTEQCQKTYGDNLNPLHVICAGYKDGKIDSCQGDSGGGLLSLKNGRWNVYGVTSFGDECGKENAYGIYTRTSFYVNWIRKIVLNNTSDQ